MSSHMNIDDNGKVNEEAKKAVLEKLKRKQTPQYQKLKSTQVTKINNDINTIVRKTWNNEKENAR